jgi:membrane protein YdbS with pleckstrin-like domain
VPRSRIQHTDVGQGPIEGRLGLAHLTVYTAGTHQASTTLAGIRYERALAIRKELTLGSGDEGDGV